MCVLSPPQQVLCRVTCTEQGIEMKGKGKGKVHRSRARLKCDGTCTETRFGLSGKRTSQFKSAGGRQFSRLLAAEVCASAVVMLDKPCSEVPAIHSIRKFPFTPLPVRRSVPSHFSRTLRMIFEICR